MKKKLQNVLSIITILLACICCCFVVYQTHQCIEKYKAFPKSTEVYIAKASKYSYPDLSFCDSNQDIVHRRRALFYSRNHEMSPQLRNCDSTFDNFRLNSALTDWILRQVQHWKMSSICFSQVFKALFTTKANLLSIDSCHKVVCQKSYVILTLKIIFQIF